MKIPTSISLLTGKGLQFKITGAFPADVNEEICAEAFRTERETLRGQGEIFLKFHDDVVKNGIGFGEEKAVVNVDNNEAIISDK